MLKITWQLFRSILPWIKDNTGVDSCQSLEEETCGIRDDSCEDVIGFTKRIVGGKEACPHEFPWAVLFKIGRKANRCGGVLINKRCYLQWLKELNSELDFVSRFVLSAGHCFEGIRNGEPITITLGEHNTERRENSEVVLKINYRPGFNVFVHDKYDAPGNKVSLNLTF